MQKYIDTLVQMQRIIVNYLDTDDSTFTAVNSELRGIGIESSNSLLYRYLELLSKVSKYHCKGCNPEKFSRKICDLINVFYFEIKIHTHETYDELDKYDELFNELINQFNTINNICKDIKNIVNYKCLHTSYSPHTNKFKIYVESLQIDKCDDINELITTCNKVIKHLTYIFEKLMKYRDVLATYKNGKYYNSLRKMFVNINILQYVTDTSGSKYIKLCNKIYNIIDCELNNKQHNDLVISEPFMIKNFQHNNHILQYLIGCNIIKNRNSTVYADTFNMNNCTMFGINDVRDLKYFIEHDDIDGLTKYISEHKFDFDLPFVLEELNHDNILFNYEGNHIHILQYAAYCGALKCFKYLYTNHVTDLNRNNLFTYTLYSNNYELTNYIKEEIYGNSLDRDHEYYKVCTMVYNTDTIMQLNNVYDPLTKFKVYFKELECNSSLRLDFIIDFLIDNDDLIEDRLYTQETNGRILNTLFKYVSSRLFNEIILYFIKTYDSKELIKIIKELYDVSDEYIKNNDYDLRMIIYANDKHMYKWLTHFLRIDKGWKKIAFVENYDNMMKYLDEYTVNIRLRDKISKYMYYYIVVKLCDTNRANELFKVVDGNWFMNYYINESNVMTTCGLMCNNYEVAFKMFDISENTMLIKLNEYGYVDVLNA